MEAPKYYVNYQELWKDIQHSNRFTPSFSTKIRAGISYLIYQLCEIYKYELDKQIGWGRTIDPNDMLSLFVDANRLAMYSPYHIKSVTQNAHLMNFVRLNNVIKMETIFGNSKYQVIIPLKYFHQLSDVKYLDPEGVPRKTYGNYW